MGAVLNEDLEHDWFYAHYFVPGKRRGYSRDDVGSPGFDVLRDALALNHDHLDDYNGKKEEQGLVNSSREESESSQGKAKIGKNVHRHLLAGKRWHGR